VLAGVSPRAGANHHLGDDSFVAKLGRPPDAADPEPLRMRVHLEYVRDYLDARPATRPALAAKRAELLSYLDDYIAKGTTPINTYVPHRTPVFIDARGTICAVGYLIERSVGRALPEQIAATHRLDFLEDIAEAMPAVRAWVEESGFTLEELASIQPAYAEPDAIEWKTWDLAKYPQPDGPYNQFGAGTMRRNRMEGEWKVVSEDGTVAGKGTMRRGAGTWTSSFADGKPLASGPYVANRAEGAWKLFHPSGNLAGEGSFIAGTRTGPWTFYYDTAAKTPIARGRFNASGQVTGTWMHFDPSGKLYASSFAETPAVLWGDASWSTNGGQGFHLDLVAARGEVKHKIHQGTVGSQHQRLDSLSLGDDRIYIQYSGEAKTIYDADGWKLEQAPDGAAWQASDCRWGSTRKRIARGGDIAYLHGLLYKELRDRQLVSPDDFGGPMYSEEDRAPRACRAAVRVSAARAKRIETLLAAADRVGVVPPAFVREAKLGDYHRQDPDEPDEWELAREESASSFTRVLAEGMTAWRQWPHVDRLFVRAFATMPGRFTKHWVDGDPQEPSADPSE
jgi:hypothetical protein